MIDFCAGCGIIEVTRSMGLRNFLFQRTLQNHIRTPRGKHPPQEERKFRTVDLVNHGNLVAGVFRLRGRHGMKEISLSKGLVALVDDDDYEWLSKYKWYACRGKSGWYAVHETRQSEGGRVIRMHREIVDAQPGELVDHWNHDTLDNRRENLRLCSDTQNCANQKLRVDNTSGYKGVGWNSRVRKWRAQLGMQGHRVHLGLFESPVDAARAYNAAAIKYFGEFAYLNDV